MISAIGPDIVRSIADAGMIAKVSCFGILSVYISSNNTSMVAPKILVNIFFNAIRRKNFKEIASFSCFLDKLVARTWCTKYTNYGRQDANQSLPGTKWHYLSRLSIGI